MNLNLLLFLLIGFANRAAFAGVYTEYFEIKDDIRNVERKISEAQDKVSELNTTWNHFWSSDSTQRKIDFQFEIINEQLVQLKSLHKRKKFLETRQQVRVWSTINGQLNSQLRKLGDLLECDCGLVEKGEDLYTDVATVDALSQERRDMYSIAAFASGQNSYVKECLEMKSMGDSANVSQSSRSLCKLPDEYRGTSYAYRIEHRGNALVLKANINVSIVGAEENKDEIKRRTALARNCIMEFYARHGIAVELVFDTNSSLSHNHHHMSITMHDQYERADASNWATHRTVGRNLTDSDVCALAIHEFGHKLGLPDTYVDPKCPDRPSILPYPNVMSNSHYHPDDLELNDDQIKSILGSLCGP